MTTDSRWLEEQMNPPKRVRGKDRPKIVSPTNDDLNRIYDRVSPYMHPVLREYFHKKISGDVAIDPVKEAELLISLLTLHTSKIINKGIEETKVTKDEAQLIGETRLAIKDHFEMLRKQEEMERKYGDEGRTVNPIRESSLGIFESFHREPATADEGSGD